MNSIDTVHAYAQIYVMRSINRQSELALQLIQDSLASGSIESAAVPGQAVVVVDSNPPDADQLLDIRV